jgi:tetratricopeptide (TPR) repeat protein
MLTTKNWRASLAWLAPALGLIVTLAGCTPPGPRALLDGERLLRKGNYAQAVTRLRVATQLLPANAQAWNHLGLAYHHSGQPDAALKAYEQARHCDPNLTSVRFNLGSLLLEQNQPQEALSELTAYTLLERDSADGWLKLATAQMRVRQPDAAERSLQTSLRLRAGQPEAWNALGVIQTQRKRPKDALNCFTLALQKDPKYAPALLNLGILYQHGLNNRGLALQTYQEYLDLKPTPPNAAAVQEAVRQLRAELAPPPRREATNIGSSVAAPPAPPVSNTLSAAHIPADLVSARVPTNAPVVSAPLPTNRVRTPVANLVSTADTAPITKSAPEAERRSEPPRRHIITPLPMEPKPATNLAKAEVPPKVEVVQISEEPPPKLAQDDAPVSTPPVQTVTNLTSAQVQAAQALLARRPEEAPPLEPAPSKRRIVDRINPTTWFRGKRRGASGPTPLDSTPESRTTSQPETIAMASRLSESSQPAPPLPAPERHYTYRSPAKPAAGDRAKAESVFAQAVLAHRDRHLAEAIDNYRQAIKLDPSFFEAQYNLGLAAYELKELPLSLSAYETALSINPTSDNARYNFALALEQGAYYQDAASELENLLKQHPEETRAHFSVAGLYADKLARPDLARPHYRKVLELEPQHPQASAIRFWLAANP